MNYKEYFDELSNNIKYNDNFPCRNHFKQSRNTDYYMGRSCKGLKYSFVVSTENSKIYGEDFKGFIIELLFEGKNYKNNFDRFKNFKNYIEESIPDTLFWQEGISKNRCRIYASCEVEDIEDKSRWNEYQDWQIKTMMRFLDVFSNIQTKLQEKIT